jgi:hypothetical protein
MTLVRRPLSVKHECSCQPVARGALGGGDFALRHFGGDLDAQHARLLVAVHGREVEPFVRRHQIGRRAAGRAHHAALEELLVCGGGLGTRQASGVHALITGHVGLPCSPSSLLRAQPRRVASAPEAWPGVTQVTEHRADIVPKRKSATGVTGFT